MNSRRHAVLYAVLVVLALAAGTAAKLTPEQVAKLPAASTAKVDFARDVKPIFDSACVKCHGKGKEKGGFSIETRAVFFKGGDSGSPVISGKSAESLLIELVSGLDPENVMPAKGSKLKAEQVALLRAWIDQGTPWPDEVKFTKAPVHNLHPRKPELPAARNGDANPIDRLLSSYFATHNVAPRKQVEDRVYARRVYLDVVGLLPTPKELNEFLSDTRPDKRALLVAKLLSDNRRYAEHWLTFWNDLLRNDYRGTGYIDGGRKQISSWLFSALLTNMPYDRFVTRLIHPTAESEGFVKGIVWRGVVNASQTPEMQAAQNISQVFMGVNLKCASCHDSFINDWTLADAYALANIYSEKNLELFECDKPTGKQAAMRFLYPQLGAIDSNVGRTERQKQLANVLTGPKNGRLSRTIVNRLWARFMGRGLVEPLDDMENPAWHAGLLDWLAEDLVANGYDLKKTMERMLTSDVYQWPAAPAQEQNDKQFLFRGPTVRRMSAEQFVDSLGCLTGVWHSQPAGEFDFTCLDFGPTKLDPAVKWIWSDAAAATKAPPGRIYFRKTIVMDQKPDSAFAVIACDNSFTMYVNGEEAASGKDYTKTVTKDLTRRLKAGTNVFALIAANHTRDNKLPPEDKSFAPEAANPAGLYVYVRLTEGKRKTEFGTDKTWRWTQQKADNWHKVETPDDFWTPAAELGDASLAAWKMEKKIGHALAATSLHGRIRSALVTADPLTV